MTQYRVYQVDAFTKERFKGNPAGVVPDADGLTDSQMLAIANELGNSETAYLLPPESSDHDLRIRFFTPTIEVPNCGHATIAAHYVRAKESQMPSGTVVHRVQIGDLTVRVVKEEDDYKIYTEQGEIEFRDPYSPDLSAEIVAALSINQDDIDPRAPLQFVSTGNGKVMVPIKSRETLNSLKPNLSALQEISTRIDCTGYFVFTLDSDMPDILTFGRMFAPAIGISEDPVTGNANGPLGAYLVQHRLVEATGDTFKFVGAQGEALGRLGTVEVIVEVEDHKPLSIQIGGSAVIAFETTIDL